MSATDSNPTTAVDLFLLATGTALVLLTVEWLIVSNFGFGLEQGEVARALTGVLVLGLCIGIAGCCVALLLRQYGALAAFAATVAMLLFMEVYAALGNHPVAKLLGSGGFAIVVFMVIVRLTGKLPAWLLRPANTLGFASVLLVLALLQTATSAVDNTGVWSVVATAILAAILLFIWWRGRRERLLEPILVLIVVSFISISFGSRIPVWQPDNSFAAGKASVLLVTIDTLRADHVG
ncbi:MAG: hypothetical protein KJN90_10365, partial [Gammaproteobacteria bacterium]|nr:hypothetical protein [Gammaproteobacteria bacterium]